MTINPRKLLRELLAAGIPAGGASSDGRIDFLPEATQQQRDEAAAILAAHIAAHPGGILYNGEGVEDADGVDRITIRKIRNVIRPDTDDAQLQASAEIRQIKNAVAANLALTKEIYNWCIASGMAQTPQDAAILAAMNAALLQNQMVDAIRAEGSAFKAAHGWD